MDRTRLHQLPDVPGTWQYWAEAEPGYLWLVPADDTAQTYLLHTCAVGSPNGFLRVSRQAFTTAEHPAPITLF